MICPVCKNDMIVVEYNKIELDYCTRCQGVWFDWGELELLLDAFHLEKPDQFLSNILKGEESNSSEKKRRCPICAQQMKKTTIGEQPKILIDACRRGDGLWFDGGEVGQLIKHLAIKQSGKPGSQQEVVTFLGDTFKARE